MKRAAANGTKGSPKGPHGSKGSSPSKGPNAHKGSSPSKGGPNALKGGPPGGRGGEERLIYFAAVVHKTTILGAHSSVEEDYMGIVAEAMYQLPPNLSRYTRSYDGTMLVFLVADDGIIYMLGGHEAMGKERAFGFLRQLREVHIRAATNQAGVFISSLLTSPYNTALQRLSSRIKHLMASVKGPIPHKRRLEMYPDAPRAYLTHPGGLGGLGADYLSEGEGEGGEGGEGEGEESESSSDDAAKERLKRALAEVDEEDSDEDARLASSFAAGRCSAAQEGGTLRGSRERGKSGVAKAAKSGEETEEEDFVWNPRTLSRNPLSDLEDDSPKISPRPLWSQQLEILREQQMGTSIALQGRGLGAPGCAVDAKVRPAPVQFRALFSTPVDPQSPLDTGPMGGGAGADNGLLLGAEGGGRQGRGQGVSGPGGAGKGGSRKARHRHLLNMTWSQELGYVNSQLEKVHAQRLAQAMASQGVPGGSVPRDAKGGGGGGRDGAGAPSLGARAAALGLTPLVPRGGNGALEDLGEGEEEGGEEGEGGEGGEGGERGQYEDDLLADMYLSKSYSVDYAAVLRRVQSATAARERLTLALQPPVYPTQGHPRGGGAHPSRSISSGRWAQAKGSMAASVVSPPEADGSSSEIQLIAGYEYSDVAFKKRPKFLSEEFVQGRGPASGAGPTWRGPTAEQGKGIVHPRDAKGKKPGAPGALQQPHQRFAAGRPGDGAPAFPSTNSVPRHYPKAFSMGHGPPTGVRGGELPWMLEMLREEEKGGAGGRRGGGGRKAVRVVEEDGETDSRGESDEGRGGGAKRREERRQLRRRARSLKEQQGGWGGVPPLGVPGGGPGAPQLRRVRPELEGDGLPPVRLHFSEIFDRPRYAPSRAPAKRGGGTTPKGASAPKGGDLAAHPGDGKLRPGSAHDRAERAQGQAVGRAEGEGKKGGGGASEAGRRRVAYSDDLTYKSQLEARSRAMQGVLAAHQRGNYKGHNGSGGDGEGEGKGGQGKEEAEEEEEEEEEEEFAFPILVGSRAPGANRSFTGELVQRRGKGLYASVVEELEEGEEEGEEEGGEGAQEGGSEGDVSEEEWIKRIRKTKGVVGQHDKGISLRGSSVGEGLMRVVTGEYARGAPHQHQHPMDRAHTLNPRPRLPSRFVSEDFSRSLRKTSFSQGSKHLDSNNSSSLRLPTLGKSRSHRGAEGGRVGGARAGAQQGEGGAQGPPGGAPQAGQGSWIRSVSQEFSSRTSQLYQRKRGGRRRGAREGGGSRGSGDGRSETDGGEDTTGDEGEESDTMGVVVLPRAASERAPSGPRLHAHNAHNAHAGGGGMAGASAAHRERALPVLAELSGEKSGERSRASPAASGGVATLSGGGGSSGGGLSGGSLRSLGGTKGAGSGSRAKTGPDTKVRGKILEIAPSGLPWHEEIARMLAEQGVQVKPAAGGEDDEDDESAKEGPREGPKAATRALPGAGTGSEAGSGTASGSGAVGGAGAGRALPPPDAPSPLGRLSPSSSTSSNTAGGAPGLRPATAGTPGAHQGDASSSRASPSGGSTRSGSPHATGAGRLLSQLASPRRGAAPPPGMEQHPQAQAEAQAQAQQGSSYDQQYQALSVGGAEQGSGNASPRSPGPVPAQAFPSSQASEGGARGPSAAAAAAASGGPGAPAVPTVSAAAVQTPEQKSLQRAAAAPGAPSPRPAAAAPRKAPASEPEQPKACCVIL